VQVVKRLQQRVSEQAIQLLKTRWMPAPAGDNVADDDAAAQPADAVWQAHTQQLGEVLSIFCSCHADVHAAVVDIASNTLTHVATSGTGASKKQAIMVGDFPSLSSQTFHVWFR
jgi:hypothetical protein